MKANWKLCALVVVALVFVLQSRPLGWGPDGHKIVCGIAINLLSAEDAATVQRLARRSTHPDGAHSSSFQLGCTFPDDARAKADDSLKGWTRFAKFTNRHFLNVSRQTTTLPADCPDCVFVGIREDLDRFGNNALTDQSRGEALLFLGHWVGDIHQPLHISYRNDRGGNLIKVDGTYGATDLHKVWDGRMLFSAREPKDWWTYAAELTKTITAADRKQWSSDDMRAWAQESYGITIDADTQYCKMAKGECASIPGKRHLTPAYQNLFQNKMELRLKQGGVRLATLITRALQH